MQATAGPDNDALEILASELGRTAMRMSIIAARHAQVSAALRQKHEETILQQEKITKLEAQVAELESELSHMKADEYEPPEMCPHCGTYHTGETDCPEPKREVDEPPDEYEQPGDWTCFKCGGTFADHDIKFADEKGSSVCGTCWSPIE